ncbi:MAG: DUF6464 family protein, partial [Cyanobacteria bacterium J06648_11]
MTPRDITEFFYRLDRATEAFVNAVHESVEKACDDAIAGFTTFMEEARVMLPEPLNLEERDEWAESDDWLSASGNSDRYVDEPNLYRDPFTYLHYYVGDTTCRFNALNPELRCAVNPYGPCQCEHYEP